MNTVGNPEDVGIHDEWIDQVEEMEREFREGFDDEIPDVPEAVEGQPPTEDTLELGALWSKLETMRRTLEDKLKDLKDSQRKLGRVLYDRCVENGVRNIPVGGFTLRPTRKLWVNKNQDVDQQQICSALRVMGRSDLVSEGYNASSVKSLIGEVLENSPDGTLPPELGALFQYGYHEEIGARVQR